MQKIPLTRPAIEFSDVEADLRHIFSAGQLVQGPYVQKFENALANYLKIPETVVVSSGTAALHLALLALGIGPGDEVIVPDHTFPATINVVLAVGATPVIADIDPQTYNIDIVSFEACLSTQTKAVIPVHQYGRPADMKTILEIARAHNLKVIEDAACAIGAKIGNHACGTLGNIGCFSFHPRKIITTGEGGALAAQDKTLIHQFRILRNHGIDFVAEKKTYVTWGLNYRLDEISSALGAQQMQKLDEIVAARRRFAHLLNSKLADLPLQIPGESKDTIATYQSYVVVLDKRYSRDKVIKQLNEFHIEATPAAACLHREPAYQKFVSGTYPGSSRLHEHGLTLPLYPQMSESEVEKITETLRKILS